MSDGSYRTNDRRVISWLLLGLVLVFGGLYVAGYLLASDRVPRGTTVSGVELGGLRPAAARARLSDALDARRQQPITVTALDRRGRIEPLASGLDLDVAASVEQAGGGRSWHPSRVWDSLTGGDDLDAVVLVNDKALDEAVAAFADKVDEHAHEGRVVFKRDQARPRSPSTGEVVDREAAKQRLTDAYLTTDTVALETVVTEPEITQVDVSRAMDEFANPALAGPVTILLGGERIVVRPRVFGPTLSLVPDNGKLVPRLDGDELVRRIERRMKASPTSPKNATVRIAGGHAHAHPKVVPAKNGVRFHAKDVTDAFLDVVVQDDKARKLRVPAKVKKPKFSTQDARDLGITEKVSEFTTYFPHSDYRNTNLGRAAHLVNNTVLKPGDEFSLNDVVGRRTAHNGFVKGYIISDGVYKADFGGGVSQVATTTFNAMFFAGLEDVEHKPHSFYIDRYPIGREATVAWPSVDLRFRNNTRYGVLVESWIDPSTPSTSGAMHVRMWSTKVWDIRSSHSARYNATPEQTRRLDGDGCVPHTGYAGFDIDVHRKFYRPGKHKLDHRETFHTTYTPSDTVVCS